MSEDPTRAHTNSWPAKFACAFRGVYIGVVGQSSFIVHIAFTVAVLLAGYWLQVSRLELCVLILCISLVVAAELMNSAIEALAKAVDEKPNEYLRNSLDMASGSVLLAALGASATGLIIFVRQAWLLWQA